MNGSLDVNGSRIDRCGGRTPSGSGSSLCEPVRSSDRGHLLSEGTPEQVMKFMMNHQVYANAIPDIYKAQLVLEEEGCHFEKPFLSVSDAQASIARAVKGE